METTFVRKTPAKKLAQVRAYKARRRKDPAYVEATQRYMREWRVQNREKKRATDKAWQVRNLHRIRITRKAWKSKHYEARVSVLVQNHNGRCDLCAGPPDGRWKRLNIDHCHKTEVFRGMLCSKCNRAIGLFKDDSALIRRAADYLDRGGAK